MKSLNGHLRILLVERSAAVRKGLRMYLGLSNAVLIAGETDCGAQCLALADALLPDVILMDGFLPDMTCATAINSILDVDKSRKVLVFGTVSDPRLVAQTLSAGAVGYVTKRMSGEALTDAIMAASRNEFSIDQYPAEDLLRELDRLALSDRLTAQELAALQYAAKPRAGMDAVTPLKLPFSRGMREALEAVAAQDKVR